MHDHTPVLALRTVEPFSCAIRLPQIKMVPFVLTLLSGVFFYAVSAVGANSGGMGASPWCVPHSPCCVECAKHSMLFALTPGPCDCTCAQMCGKKRNSAYSQTFTKLA